MADAPKKPKKIKDLKARLGRTIQPSTQGGAIPPPGIAPPPGSVAPPPGGVVAPPGGVVAPPASVAPPFGGVAPSVSPFAPPAPISQQQQARPSSPADPFGAVSHAPAAREVRLVIDESPVDDAEIGRKSRGKTIILVAAGLLVGLVLGAGVGSMVSDRRLYNQAVVDGKEIFGEVQTASETMTKAQRFIDAAATAARGGPGKAPAVDYQAIEALQGLEKPFAANQFSQRRYKAFTPAAVDGLFEYFNRTNQLWERFGSLAGTTLPEARRTQLNAAAEAAGQMASSQTGCVPMTVENRMFCGLVYVDPPNIVEGQPPPTKLTVRTSRRAPRGFEKEIYTGQPLAENPDSFVILTHTQRSVGVLGEPASAFAEYQRDITQLKALMDGTIEVQGRLETELGAVARLEEIFTL